VNGAWAAPVNGSVSSQYTAYMLVNSAANLQNLDANDAGTYALGKDIDLSSISNFIPLGQTSPNFTGILDGMGHTINNLTISSSNANVGLFDTIGSAGSVRNLTLTNATIDATGLSQNVAILAGASSGTISNVSSSGVVNLNAGIGYGGGLLASGSPTNLVQYSNSSATINAASTDAWVGGLVGISFGTVDHSFASGNVNGGYESAVGGLVGGATSVSNSYATGNITSPVADLGGLVGFATGPITNSYATGAVSATYSLAASVAGGLVGFAIPGASIVSSYATGPVSVVGTYSTAGGLAGALNVSANTVTNSYATGSVTSTGAYSRVGGLIGYTDGNVTNSFALGNVSGTGTDSTVGGLVGYSDADATISVSYALGNVTGGAYAFAGGLVGSLYGNANDTYAHGSVTAANNSYIAGSIADFEGNSVTNSYSTGFVSTTGPGSQVQGFMGYMDGVTVSNNYFDNQSSGVTTDAGGAIGETTATLKSGVMPVGFNATPSDSPWIAPAGVYPYFGWQGPLVTVSGTAYNGSTVIPSAGVNALSNGYLLGSLTTNGSGFYSISEPQNMVQNGVLTYLTSNGTANTFSDGAGPNGFTNMNLYVGTLNVLNASYTNLSSLNAALANTLGSNTASNFLFSVPNGQLSPNSGTNVWIAASAPSFTVDQPLTTSGNILINSTGNLTLAANDPITSGSGDNITLATGAVFTNNAGSNALNTGEGGNWQVYSQNPANDTTGGLAENYIQYNATYGVTTPAAPGNGFLYTLAPVITESLTGSVSKTYDGTTAATLSPDNFTYSGNIQGDTVTFSLPSSGTYSSANAGTGIEVTAGGISILSASNGNIPVYGYQLASPTISANIGTILGLAPPPNPNPNPNPNPSPAGTTLTIDINNATSLTGQLPAFSATYAGAPVNGIDLASILSGLSYQITPALNGPGTYQISATGTAPAGYTLNIVDGTFTVVDGAPATLPTQTSLFAPLLPNFLPEPVASSAIGLLAPINSLGLFQVEVTSNPIGSASPAAASGTQSSALSQSVFFSGINDKTEKYAAGAKP
jgi:hypothetical protein